MTQFWRTVHITGMNELMAAMGDQRLRVFSVTSLNSYTLGLLYEGDTDFQPQGLGNDEGTNMGGNAHSTEVKVETEDATTTVTTPDEASTESQTPDEESTDDKDSE